MGSVKCTPGNFSAATTASAAKVFGLAPHSRYVKIPPFENPVA